ncbi:CbtB domain-containing protein [Litorisediminicola beolgyonensis]|uniref:CbtB-domain containing protein n=1 Tax=Litorisediminicola beolgyonensis TaxID=1173614 RepID=A0ABW3ZGX8_9RHOB
MTQALTALRDTSVSHLAAIALTFALGAGIVFVAGHVQAAALHDAAHDMRHATGFPCH